MALAHGLRLGPYQIVSALGAGGMGEVYRARDTRIGRDVALKVISPAFSADADRLRRFENEARSAGLLNHPNVLAIYDVGSHDGAPYLVSELLDGETLREKLEHGPLSSRKVINFALQIARGLAAAHEKKIVHRDLKPENLFLTEDGRIKILDFGLAKLKPPLDGTDPNASTQTLSTAPGVVMGTVGYMSPEQVRAEDVDHRSDIFAFGAILYEMLSGRCAFQGNSAAEVMNAILKAEPPEINEPNRDVPAALEQTARRCLEKQPVERFQLASDLGYAIEALAMSSGKHPIESAMVQDTTAVTKRSSRRELTAWIAAGVITSIALWLAVSYNTRPPVDTEAVRFSIFPPEKTTITSSPTISPDGRRLAFTAAAEEKTQLWVRPMGSLAAEPLPGTEGAADPFWSPDSHFLGFFAQGKLKKIAISGGAPRTLCDAPNPRGGSWSRDGVIVFTPHTSAGVHRVSAAGGSVAAVTMLDEARQESTHRWPSFLPDGRHFLCLVFGAKREEIGVFLASLETREMKRLVTTESNALYAPPGFLLFAREGALMAQPFDAAERQLTGEPFRLADRVEVSLLRRASLSASDNAVLVYDSSGGSQDCRLGWFSREGKRLEVIGSTGLYQSVRLSPDEKRLVVSQRDRQTRTEDIWLLDLSRGTDSRFTFDPASDGSPIWSPDGGRVAWNSNRDGLANLYQKVTSGAGEDELLLKSNTWKHPVDWSEDSRFILYVNNDPKTISDLWILPLEGNREPFPFAQTQFIEMQGRFYPDSKWIAYVSNESGSWEVYVQDFPTSGGKLRISSRGGTQPIWRGDGKELFYISADQKLMAVEVKSGTGAKEGFEIGVPRPLFNFPAPGILVNYDVTDDGRRFLIVTNEETTPSPITVVLNWAAELKR